MGKEMTFDPNKPYRCKDGSEARVSEGTSYSISWPLTGKINLPDGKWAWCSWTKDGYMYGPHCPDKKDLINIEEEKPMTKPLDLTKPLRTSDGEGRVTIYCVDAPGVKPVHGRVDYACGSSVLLSWHLDGSFSASGPMNNDLINEPESTVRWVNIHEDERGILSLDGLFKSKDQADALCYHDQRIGRIRIDNYRRFDE